MKGVWNRDNLILAFNRLITNPESTYKNYFRNTYSAYGMSLNDNINLLRKKKLGYLPHEAVRTFLPKANGLTRLYTLLTIEDQIVYQAYGNIIADHIIRDKNVVKRYKKSVFGNLYAGSESQFFYKKWQDSYSAYTKAVKSAYEDGYEYIASFDLTACYDSINHELIRNTLIHKFKADVAFANGFISLLRQWTSTELQLAAGIPQGPLTSGIIAEVVLSEYDEEIEKLQKRYDFRYYRYVDDIRVLSKNEETVKWILFLLDKKSKELGLFPQSSKITIHRVENIDDEIKSISKPLFDEDIEEDKKSQVAAISIKRLLKSENADMTSIKRYFSFVKQDADTNTVALEAIKMFPNLIHSFAYYVKRYPRRIPPRISEYIYQCCQDKTQQFAAGILLESIIDNISRKDISKYLDLAKKLIAEDKKEHFIVDCRFQSQLIMFVLYYDTKFGRAFSNYLKKCCWWVKGYVVYQAITLQVLEKFEMTTMRNYLCSEQVDISIPVAYSIVISGNKKYMPTKQSLIGSISQVILKQSGIIRRKQISTTQINSYLKNLTSTEKRRFQWKRKLGREHDEIERKIFTALGYWNTDLTAFVNIWDTINDKVLSLVVADHSAELGGYNLGSLGSIKDSKKMKAVIPKFHYMCNEIHELRLSSELSHFEIKKKDRYTGPIPQNKRNIILKLIREGYEEIQEYW